VDKTEKWLRAIPCYWVLGESIDFEYRNSAAARGFGVAAVDGAGVVDTVFVHPTQPSSHSKNVSGR